MLKSTDPVETLDFGELQELFPEVEILDLIGRGGTAAVYLARQKRLDRLVALKILTCPREFYDDFVLRFELEARVLAKLRHPNIVTIYGFGEVALSGDEEDSGSMFYFLMEYVDGADLRSIIRTGKLDPSQTLRIVTQACDALQYAHDEGITHRDIKSANILVDKRGNVRIADFGIAKLTPGENETLTIGLTVTGTAIGTPHYMAPEQWDHPEKVDHRADIYSLGVVFYEMLTGIRPQGIFQPPSESSGADPRLDTIVFRAMEYNIDRRYQHASEIRDDITKALSLPIAKGRKRAPSAILVAAVLSIAIAVGSWETWSRQRDISERFGGGETQFTDKTLANHEAAQPIRIHIVGMSAGGNPIGLSRAQSIDFIVDARCVYSEESPSRTGGQSITSGSRIGEANDALQLAGNTSVQFFSATAHDGHLFYPPPGTGEQCLMCSSRNVFTTLRSPTFMESP